MGKLHEILAVDKELEDAAKKIVAEAIVTFSKKSDLFLGHLKRLEMFSEDRKNEESAAAEQKALTTTVDEKLDYVAESLIRHIDVVAQKESTNQKATADVVLRNGRTILIGLPATFLLSLENKLAWLRKMYETIPTLQPGIKWDQDPQERTGVFKAQADDVRIKGEKTVQSKILVPSTDRHPAQLEKWFEDKPIGQFVTTRWSGMVSPATKSAYLDRIDDLIQAVKKSRMRANAQEVEMREAGATIMNYINGDDVKPFMEGIPRT